MTVAFVNGCFDSLHNGHRWFLWHAWAHGDELVVGVNSDSSVRRLKGPGRPLFSEGERREMLLSLPWVRRVVIFDGLTAAALLRGVRPGVVVKGDGLTLADLPAAERAVIAEIGCRVVTLPRQGDWSTTKLLEASK